MAAERVNLDVRVREERGSAAVRRLRKTGFVPGVVYGGNAEPTAISVAERELRKALTTDHGLNAIMDVKLNGDTRPVILKEFQRDPITGRVAHIDLVVVRLDRPIQTAVTVEIVGESPGAKEGGASRRVAAAGYWSGLGARAPRPRLRLRSPATRLRLPTSRGRSYAELEGIAATLTRRWPPKGSTSTC